MLSRLSLGLAILSLVRSSIPGVDPRAAVNFIVPFFISSVLLNLTLTLLIAGRLLYLRRQMPGASGGSTYFSLASMLVESSLLQTICGVAACVSFVVDQASSTFLVIILGEVVVRSLVLLTDRTNTEIHCQLTVYLPHAHSHAGRMGKWVSTYPQHAMGQLHSSLWND